MTASLSIIFLQGTFVTPRGRYAIQMTTTYFRMQGAQYDYKILYTDIANLFLLPKPDDVRTAFVISLEKPIRQGNQKYQHLVLETHKLEHTLIVNLSAEDLVTKYDGQLAKEMTMPMCNLFAKVFKVLTQSTVYVPKHFVSDRRTHCVKCSLKANEGLLYPLSKSFIFIHKPTIIISFEDVELIEFQRYKSNASSATRNFDMIVTVKAGSASAGEARDYNFSGIDRAEYGNLVEFLSSKKIRVKEEADTAKPLSVDWNEGEEEDEGSEEDDDYEGDNQSGDSSDGSYGSEEEVPDTVKKPPSRGKEKSLSKRSAPLNEGPKKKRSRKDKDAPKGAKSAYAIFVQQTRGDLKAANPAASFGDLARMSAEAWKALPSEGRARYEAMAKADKERFAAAMKHYRSQKKYAQDSFEGNEDDYDD